MRQMKDSGVKWIGEIPADWGIRRLKNLPDPTIENSYVDGDWIESPDISIEGIRYLTTGNIGDGEYKEQGHGYITEETFSRLNCKYAYPGDLVISRLNSPYGRSCLLPDDYPCYVLAVDNVILRPTEEKRYICYVTQCDGYQDSVADQAKGTTMKRISRTNLGNIIVPIPSRTIQNRISDYLDSKCSQIDYIIEKQEALIERLKEYKLSVITEAVTKGLNPKIEFKKCNVEWIDTIPYHWESIKLKNCSYIRARLGWKGLKAEEYVEEGFPLLSAFNIVDDKIDFDHNINFINQYRYDESPEIKLSVGDILLVKDGAGIGKCGIVEVLPLPSTTNGSLAVITTDNKVHSKFLYYYFLSSVFQRYVDRIKDGMGVPHLFQSDLREIQIVLPPYEEQVEIVGKLENQISKANEKINNTLKIIEQIRDYKKSLIYECVTGKKEI